MNAARILSRHASQSINLKLRDIPKLVSISITPLLSLFPQRIHQSRCSLSPSRMPLARLNPLPLDANGLGFD